MSKEDSASVNWRKIPEQGLPSIPALVVLFSTCSFPP